MSKLQKKILMTALLLMALAALFPPTVRKYNAGYHTSRGFLFSENVANAAIYIEKLIAELIFIAATTAFFMVLDKGIFSWAYQARHSKQEDSS